MHVACGSCHSLAWRSAWVCLSPASPHRFYTTADYHRALIGLPYIFLYFTTSLSNSAPRLSSPPPPHPPPRSAFCDPSSGGSSRFRLGRSRLSCCRHATQLCFCSHIPLHIWYFQALVQDVFTPLTTPDRWAYAFCRRPNMTSSVQHPVALDQAQRTRQP